MKTRTVGLLGLQLRFALVRFGWINGVALMLCGAGLMAWLVGIPHLRERLDLGVQTLALAHQALQSADGPAPVAQRSTAEERLVLFYDTLGEKHYAEQQVKTLFALAAKSNLTLSQAEYKLTFDKNGRYYSYQIQLPVKGPYPAIREFCEQTLLSISFASLDELNFKRESIASPTPEAKLRFTLYLNDIPAQSESLVSLDMKEAMP